MGLEVFSAGFVANEMGIAVQVWMLFGLGRICVYVCCGVIGVISILVWCVRILRVKTGPEYHHETRLEELLWTIPGSGVFYGPKVKL